MPINEPFVALRALQAPGTMVFGFQPGDPVPAGTVESWELVIGTDVRPTNTAAVPRPDDSAGRAEWEAYAIGQGMPIPDAQAASLEDLRATPEPEPDEHGNPAEAKPLPDPDAPMERPGDDARKAEWVSYAKSLGADETWADDKATTKADLMAYEPRPAPDEVGDPLAVNATELAATDDGH